MVVATTVVMAVDMYDLVINVVKIIVTRACQSTLTAAQIVTIQTMKIQTKNFIRYFPPNAVLDCTFVLLDVSASHMYGTWIVLLLPIRGTRK